MSIPTAEITQSGNTAFDKKKPLIIGAVLSLPEYVRVGKPFVSQDSLANSIKPPALPEFAPRSPMRRKIFSFQIANEAYFLKPE